MKDWGQASTGCPPFAWGTASRTEGEWGSAYCFPPSGITFMTVIVCDPENSAPSLV